MSSYRSLLLELSNNLTTADLQELKFLCGEVIPAGRLEKINRGFELFGALEQLNMLSEENRDFLASKLIAVSRNDLRNKLLGIQGKLLAQISGLNIIFYHGRWTKSSCGMGSQYYFKNTVKELKLIYDCVLIC